MSHRNTQLGPFDFVFDVLCTVQVTKIEASEIVDAVVAQFQGVFEDEDDLIGLRRCVRAAVQSSTLIGLLQPSFYDDSFGSHIVQLSQKGEQVLNRELDLTIPWSPANGFILQLLSLGGGSYVEIRKLVLDELVALGAPPIELGEHQFNWAFRDEIELGNFQHAADELLWEVPCSVDFGTEKWKIVRGCQIEINNAMEILCALGAIEIENDEFIKISEAGKKIDFRNSLSWAGELLECFEFVPILESNKIFEFEGEYQQVVRILDFYNSERGNANGIGYPKILESALHQSPLGTDLNDSEFHDLAIALFFAAIHFQLESDPKYSEEVFWWCSEALPISAVPNFTDPGFKKLDKTYGEVDVQIKLRQIAAYVLNDPRSLEIVEYGASCEAEPNAGYQWIVDYFLPSSSHDNFGFELEKQNSGNPELLKAINELQAAYVKFGERFDENGID